MTAATKTRRQFLVGTAASAGLVVAFGDLAFAYDAAVAPTEAPSAPLDFVANGWIRLRTDGRVELTVGRTEIGQGVRTSLAMILAEELGAAWESVDVVQTVLEPPVPPLNTAGGVGGSDSMSWGWEALRPAAAGVRAVLIAEAAQRWECPREECDARDGAVHHAASGRRAAFVELLGGAAVRPLPMSPTLRTTSAAIVGTRRGRVDAPDIVRGTATFGLDVRRPGQLFAALERPPAAGARPLEVDATTARAVAGVRDVVTVPEGIAVIAADTWAAFTGRAALRIRWDVPSAGDFDSDAFQDLLRQGAQGPGVTTYRTGRGLEGWESEPRRLEATYEYPFFVHAPMEPMNSTALCTGSGFDRRCTIWSPTQSPGRIQRDVAQRLAIEPAQVTVHITLAGGGFGRRLTSDYDLEAAAIAAALPGTPIQLVWTRTDDLRFGHFQSASVHRLRAAWDADGTARRWGHRKVSALHSLGGAPSSAEIADPEYLRDSAWGTFDVPYTFADIETEYVVAPTPVRIGPWRAVYAPSSIFARECFFDELAGALKRDPLQYRLDMLGGPDTFEAGGLSIDRRRLRHVLETLRQRSGWGRPLPKGRGRGVACEVFHTGTHVAYVAEVSVDKKQLRVEKITAVVDTGRVVHPSGAEQQVESAVAWSLSCVHGRGIDFREGRATATNFNDYPVLRIGAMPALDIHFVESPVDTPLGLGEPPVSAVIPAVYNAIHAATGKRLRRLPFRAEELG